MPEEEAFFASTAFNPHPTYPFVDLKTILYWHSPWQEGDLHEMWDWNGDGVGEVLEFEFVPYDPKLVMGLRGSTADIFVDNLSSKEFLFRTFGVSLVDMESAAVLMTRLSNGFTAIVLRGLSDLAERQEGQNSINVIGRLAALNTAKDVQFVKLLPPDL